MEPTEDHNLQRAPPEHGVGYATLTSESRPTPPEVIQSSIRISPKEGDSIRSLTYINGLALVVGLQIGSGIFSSPSAILSQVGSVWLATLIWLAAGVLAWTGAKSCIELGCMVPLNGGMQEYLRFCFNDTYGFLAAWNWVLVVKPCSAAMLSLVFSEYICKLFDSLETPSAWILKGVALFAIAFVTLTNCLGTRVSANTANFFLICKLVGVGSIIVIGLILGILSSRDPSFGQTSIVNGKIENSPPALRNVERSDSSLWENLGVWTDATFAALWAYSGWETVRISR